VSVVAFQTRARTIDHLGRGQIADCPTAVSELWKNAYDAYAKKVALHIFDGKAPIAAVTDDGHGMDYEEFLTKWLIVGTDAKAAGTLTPKEDRHGLQVRQRQGEKGIGRLSVAFLGPVVFVISKRKSKPFVAALVDWRLFENPFLLLGDIQVPVYHFEDKEELSIILPEMFTQLGENIERVAKEKEVDDEAENAEAKERFARVASAWQKYTTNQKKGKLPETAAAIRATAAAAGELSTALLGRCLDQWGVWNEEVSHGTALFVLDANHELAVWVNPEVSDEDPEAVTVKKNLQETLIGFVDPYVKSPTEFDYSVTVLKGDERQDVVSSEKVFSWAELRTLEHLVEGRVDENGVFRGNVKAFGRDLGEISLPPVERPTLNARAMVGPFDICIGTFEYDRINSSLTDEQHSHVTAMADLYVGLAIYRDQLRVMPYGRVQADYFGIEERRSKNVGREFWSYRRTFGRIAIARDDNPNLKDKAGREGLIDNQAKREFRMLVIQILETTARRFFGTNAKPRKEYLPLIVAENKRAKQAEEKTQDKRAAEFKKALREYTPALKTATEEATAAKEQIKRIVAAADLGALVQFENTLQKLESEKSTLKLPGKPAKLGSLEDNYRSYRDSYTGFCATTDELRTEWAQAVEKVKKKPAVEEGRTTAAAHAEQLDKMLREWLTRILGLLGRETDRVKSEVETDKGSTRRSQTRWSMTSPPAGRSCPT